MFLQKYFSRLLKNRRSKSIGALPFNPDELPGPSSVVALPTYRCTASCTECCFEGSPRLTQTLPAKTILSFIEEAVKTFPSVKLCVFSGGEPFLFGNDLDRCIKRAAESGLLTRIVTNGYWATTEEQAYQRLLSLKNAGLTEINFSTGDEHQEWIPVDRVVNGAIASAKLNVTTAIAVEGSSESQFRVKDLFANETLQKFAENDERSKHLILATNVWVPFHKDSSITQHAEVYRTGDNINSSGGCAGIFEHLILTPTGEVTLCCGLTMEHIPEMKAGYYDIMFQEN